MGSPSNPSAPAPPVKAHNLDFIHIAVGPTEEGIHIQHALDGRLLQSPVAGQMQRAATWIGRLPDWTLGAGHRGHRASSTSIQTISANHSAHQACHTVDSVASASFRTPAAKLIVFSVLLSMCNFLIWVIWRTLTLINRLDSRLTWSSKPLCSPPPCSSLMLPYDFVCFMRSSFSLLLGTSYILIS